MNPIPPRAPARRGTRTALRAMDAPSGRRSAWPPGGGAWASLTGAPSGRVARLVTASGALLESDECRNGDLGVHNSLRETSGQLIGPIRRGLFAPSLAARLSFKRGVQSGDGLFAER